MEQVAAYVFSKEGKPLMPMHSYGRVRRLLKTKRAVVISKDPFTIQLKFHIPNPKLQEIIHEKEDR